MAKRKSDPSEGAQETGQAQVHPCEREPSKFEAVAADGTVNPYAFRTEGEAWASMGLPDPKTCGSQDSSE